MKAWTLPGTTGVAMCGASLGVALSVIGLLQVVRGIEVSGGGGIAAVAQGVMTAITTVRVLLWLSTLAAITATAIYLLRGGAAAAPKASPVLPAIAVLPIVGVTVALTLFYNLVNDLTFGLATAGGQAPQNLGGRITMIVLTAVVSLALCLAGIVTSLLMRRRVAAVHRGLAMLIVAASVAVNVAGVVVFQRLVSALNQMGATG